MRPHELPRILTTRQARALNVSRSRTRTELARGHWQSIARGLILTRPDPPNRHDWAAVGLLTAGGRAVLSGWDAARYYGVGDPTPPLAPVLVLSPKGVGRRVGGVYIRRTDAPLPSRIISADDEHLPHELLAEPRRAVLDAAMSYRYLAPVRALLTASVQRGLCTPDELRSGLAHIARRDSGLVRRALLDVMDGAHSEAEAVALNKLRFADVPPFELNVSILARDGQLIAVADFLWRELRAILEVDSRQFHFSEADWHRTSVRHNRLTAAGLAVQHYPPQRFRSGDSWLAEVIGWLRNRARELGVNYRVDPRAIRGGPPLRLPLE